MSGCSTKAKTNLASNIIDLKETLVSKVDDGDGHGLEGCTNQLGKRWIRLLFNINE